MNEPSNPIVDFGSIVFSGFSLRTDNGPETTLIKTSGNSSVQREVSIEETILNLNLLNNNITFESINESSFSGTYNINQTQVNNLSLNSININL